MHMFKAHDNDCMRRVRRDNAGGSFMLVWMKMYELSDDVRAGVALLQDKLNDASATIWSVSCATFFCCPFNSMHIARPTPALLSSTAGANLVAPAATAVSCPPTPAPS